MERVMRGDVANSFLNVEKYSELTESGQTIVTFSVTSTSELPIAMRIVDPLPDGASLSDVGFHGEHKFDHWGEVDESHVAFSDKLLPGESVDAFYYLDAEQDEEAFVPQPSIEETEPIEAELAKEAGAPTWRSQPAGVATARVVADGPLPNGFRREDSIADTNPCSDGGPLTSGDQDEPNATSGTFAELQEEHERVEYDEIREDVDKIYPDEVEFKELLIGDEDTMLPDQAEMPADGSSPDEADGMPEELDATDASPGESGVLATLLQELDERELSEDDQELLRERLGLTSPYHTTVKVRHLQTKVADLTAYIDALESFLDDNGPAGELLGSLEEDVQSIEADLNSLESSVDGVEDRQDAISTRLDAVEEALQGVSNVRTDVARTRQEIDGVSEQLDGIRAAVEYLDRRFDDEVEPLEATVDRHETRIGELQSLTETIGEKYQTIMIAFESASQVFSVSEGE